MNQKYYVDQTLQKNIHLAIKTVEYKIISLICGKEK